MKNAKTLYPALQDPEGKSAAAGGAYAAWPHDNTCRGSFCSRRHQSRRRFGRHHRPDRTRAQSLSYRRHLSPEGGEGGNGGIHPTVLPEEALKHADAVVVGEAEGVWPRLVSDAAAGQMQRIYHAGKMKI